MQINITRKELKLLMAMLTKKHTYAHLPLLEPGTIVQPSDPTRDRKFRGWGKIIRCINLDDQEDIDWQGYRYYVAYRGWTHSLPGYYLKIKETSVL